VTPAARPSAADPLADRLRRVAVGASEDSGVIPGLLGDFLAEAAQAIVRGKRLSARRVQRYSQHGEAAARDGVALSALVDLYLSASWRLWRELPTLTATVAGPASPAPLLDAGESMLRTTDDVVAAVAAGYQHASAALLAQSAATRQEFVDDLLANHGLPGELTERASSFGLRLAARHRVAVVRLDSERINETNVLQGYAAEAGRNLPGSPSYLITTKDGNLIVIVEGSDEASKSAVADIAGVLRQSRPDLRLGVGRSRAGEAGPMRSYQEATACLRLADRIPVGDGGAYADDLLVYLSLDRDPVLLEELVRSVLLPLESLRGGPGDGLATLQAYLDNRGSATATAHALHLSVRGLTYRIERIQGLLGHDLDDPQQRLTVEFALLAAKLLDWPERALESEPVA
jgi:DNA-binding PucR family transcriptional regulator